MAAMGRTQLAHEKNNKPAFADDCRTLAGIPPALILLAPTLLGVAVIAMASALDRQEIEALVIETLGLTQGFPQAARPPAGASIRRSLQINVNCNEVTRC
ncbi:MAG TPA: hypothetical protein PLU47_11165 [Azonexus sp.]|nr:hypothetical protein [Azonexus sp.]